MSFRYRKKMNLERTILRKVGEAISRFQMICDGDHVAVGVSGGKDSLTLLEVLLLLQKRAPIDFRVSAFTIEQGKFLRPIQPVGEYLRSRNIEWTYVTDQASIDLIEDQPDHGCDVCSRFRRRAVYSVARKLGANVVALGHTADDFCEAFLRNAMFTGRTGALPPVTLSRAGEFRLIRPLVYVTEDLTAAFAAALGAPVIPCGCSQKTGSIRNSIRTFLSNMEQEGHPVKESLIGAMGNIETKRLLDTRYFAPEHETNAGEGPSTPLIALQLP